MIRKSCTLVPLIGILLAGWLYSVFAESPKEFTLVAQVEGSAKVWSPATLTIPKGQAVKLIVKNTTDAPHGFAIDELRIKEEIPSGATKEMTIKVDSAGALRYYCHLHPAHVGGQMNVQ